MPSRSRRALPLITMGLALAVAAPASAAIEPGALSADGRVRAFSAALAGSGVLTGVQVADRVAGTTQDISVDERGQWVRGSQPDIDFSGRVVAFSSEAALRLDDANGLNDIYVRDRACPVAERASVGVGGAAADGPSTAPAISGDGRWVAFVSEATNLVAGDTDGSADVFVADRATGAIVRASVAADGRQGAGAWLGSSGGPPALSADGRVVAFATTARLTAEDRDNTADVYVRDLAAGGIERVPVNAERWVVKPALSADGRFVVVGEADGADVWRHDRATGHTDRMNTWPSGVGAGFEPAISADGTRVAFVGDPDPLYWPDEHGATELWVRDVGAGTTTRARPAASPAGPQWAPGISADGRWVSWAARDVVGGVHDLGAGTELTVPGVELFEGVCATPPPPGSPYELSVLADDPDGFWRLGDAPDARVARDETQGADAEHHGAVRLSAPGALTGDADTAIDLAGLGHVRIAQDFGFAGRAPFTLEAWVSPRELGSQTRRIFSSETAATGYNGDRGYLLGVRENGIFFQRYRDGRATAIGAPVRAGVWTHVVATYDGQYMRLFVDGAERATARSTLELPPGPGELVVGAKQGRWLFYRGGLDELAVYRHALAPARVSAHHAAGRGD